MQMAWGSLGREGGAAAPRGVRGLVRGVGRLGEGSGTGRPRLTKCKLVTQLDQRALSHRRSHTDRPVEHRSTHARPASTPSRRAAKGCEKAEP